MCVYICIYIYIYILINFKIDFLRCNINLAVYHKYTRKIQSVVKRASSETWLCKTIYRYEIKSKSKKVIGNND